MSVNKVILLGRLGSNPETRVTPSGKQVANVSLATSEFYKDASGQKKEKTEWHSLVFWNRVAEIVGQYCQKGSQIYVEGSLQTRQWEDKNGNKRDKTEVNVKTLQLLDSKRNTNQGGYQNNHQQGGYQDHSNPPASDQPPQDQFTEDDIPF